MNSKIIFLDVDGTLVDYHNHLPESAIQAIHQAQENGHQVYTVTGRAKAEMYSYILDIGFDGYIGGNGSYIESKGQVVKEKTLNAEDTQQIVDWLKNCGLEFYLESNNGLFASKNFASRGVKTIQEYIAYKGKPGAKQATTATVFPDMIYGESLYRDDVNKISFILDSYDDYLAAQEKFPSLKVG
ncbi:MAG: HAD-IIB family hydrolase, partial [Tetragenococcus koreensis]|nr:HAD-IIB family hydrolase [Tetragenococcus koreensis]